MVKLGFAMKMCKNANLIDKAAVQEICEVSTVDVEYPLPLGRLHPLWQCSAPF